MDPIDDPNDSDRKLNEELSKLTDEELLDIVFEGLSKPAEPGKESAAEYLERKVDSESFDVLYRKNYIGGAPGDWHKFVGDFKAFQAAMNFASSGDSYDPLPKKVSHSTVASLTGETVPKPSEHWVHYHIGRRVFNKRSPEPTPRYELEFFIRESKL